jgi:alpha-D-ribose 1-methylphosphonate 5-triphosphate diphosphatase PhnM
MRWLVFGWFVAAAVAVPVGGAVGQASGPAAIGDARDSIADLIRRERGDRHLAQTTPQVPSQTPSQGPAPPQAQPPGAAPTQPPKDPREGDATFEQAQRLMKAIDSILNDTARNRGEARKLPSSNDFLVRPLWTETREDRERKIKDLLDSALGIVTDVPVVESQKKIEGLRGNIRDIEDRIVKLREKQLTAPKDALIPGITADTVDSLERDIADSKSRIDLNKDRIAAAKEEIREALNKSGIQLAPDQLDLLLDGVLSGDLVRLVAVFNSAKLIDGQLGKLMAASGENVGAARKYFAMHAALFAILVHAQDSMIAKIDKQYLPKLDAIMTDVATARGKTAQLLRAENRPDQRRALEANRDSQRLAEEAAKGYRRYLLQQREQIARARARAIHDLRIADNTYETVEASFQLRVLMRESATSFEAIQKLEAPTFEQIFRNEELRREFESLTRKLDAPSS